MRFVKFILIPLFVLPNILIGQNQVNYDNTFCCSDSRVIIKPTEINNVLDKILLLQAIRFSLDSSYTNTQLQPNEKTIGIIAQDMQQVFPELVGENQDGYLSVDYAKFSAVLLQAIKEQQFLIDQQNQNNEKQQYQIDFLIEEITMLKSKIPQDE